MTDLISRKALLEALNKYNKKEAKYGDWIYTDEVINEITNAPTEHYSSSDELESLRKQVAEWKSKSIEREQHLQIANNEIDRLSLQAQVLREALSNIDLRAIAKKVVNDATNRFVSMKPMYDSEELMITLVEWGIDKALSQADEALGETK